MSETEVTTEVQFQDTDNLDDFSESFFGQKPTEPVETTTESEQVTEQVAEPEDTKAQEDTQSDETPEEQVEEDADEVVEEKPAKRKSAQDRIDELVRQREDVRRESEAKLEALRKEFEEFKATTVKPAQVQAEPAPTDLNEDGTDKYPLGEFDPNYIKDLTRFTLDAERKHNEKLEQEQRQAQEAAKSQMELQASWNEKVEGSKALYPDFQEKGQALLSNFDNLDAGYASYISSVIMSMDKGPDVLYYLSNHPEEAIKIVNSGAQKATLALGRIEAKFLEADAQKTLAKPKVSKAPTPPTVQARGTNGAFIAVSPDTDNLDDFEKAFFARK